MLHRVTHAIPVIEVCSEVSNRRYACHLIPIIRYDKKFLAYIMSVIMCVTGSNTCYSGH